MGDFVGRLGLDSCPGRCPGSCRRLLGSCGRPLGSRAPRLGRGAQGLTAGGRALGLDLAICNSMKF